MEAMRKPFQGTINVLRFNWHYYAGVAIFVVFLLSLQYFSNSHYSLYVNSLVVALLLISLLPILVSYYVYDHSNLYSLDWLNDLSLAKGSHIVNINGGFDETSWLLKSKFPFCELSVFDFYDARKHTEVSIKRARAASLSYPGTKTIDTKTIELRAKSADCVFLIMAAHEIRDNGERESFLRQLAETLTADGRIIIVEHLRDLPNFIAYNVGFFHFYSKKSWATTFANAGLTIDNQKKITPFINIFNLKKHVTAS